MVQVDKEETNERQAKIYGEYHIRYYLQQDAGAKKKKVRLCQHWSLINELNADRYIGAIVQITPGKVRRIFDKHPLKYVWYQHTITLAEQIITGPFDFGKTQSYMIDQKQWKELMDKADDFRVDASNVNKISPLVFD
mmetsp:Transcript_12566/g.17828  ORF Transcript_12566/g.17828 Transcript_12566/m.17828 type:complete len:137 (-) Transcript_12566:439-849(-)